MPTDAVQHAAMDIPQSLWVSLLGFAIVFVVLVVLMYMIDVLRAVLEKMDASRAAAAAAAAPVAASAAAAPKPAANMVPAKGSLGEVRLNGVDDKTAAMIMAIVADTMQAPLNELRFISIREK